jgi:hypothetical protein
MSHSDTFRSYITKRNNLISPDFLRTFDIPKPSRLSLAASEHFPPSGIRSEGKRKCCDRCTRGFHTTAFHMFNLSIGFSILLIRLALGLRKLHT